MRICVRMGRQSDEHLRCLFLQCRDLWLQTSLDDATRQGTAYQQLCKVTDVMRMHVFEIVTQYRAIFLDFSASQDEECGEGADGGLLYAWANRRMLTFIEFLQVALQFNYLQII